jgi:leader peptidase (prepilin peptidase) / N-methyltransferase
MTAARLEATAAGGLAFALAAHELAVGPLGLARFSLFGITLGALVATDLAERRIPNRVVVPAIVACLGLSLADGALGRDLAPALAIVAVFFVLALASPRALGMGDAKLALLVAVALDGGATTALVLGLALAAGASVVVIARHGPVARTRALPLAPFLAAGSLLTLVA